MFWHNNKHDKISLIRVSEKKDEAIKENNNKHQTKHYSAIGFKILNIFIRQTKVGNSEKNFADS